MSSTFNDDMRRARTKLVQVIEVGEYSHRDVHLSTLLEITALLDVIGRDVRKLVEQEDNDNRS